MVATHHLRLFKLKVTKMKNSSSVHPISKSQWQHITLLATVLDSEKYKCTHI